jgi:quercetin dioxygenase-like cupin family protein
MRANSILLFAVVVVLAGLVAVGGTPSGAVAQEGTPMADAAAPIGGAVIEILDIGEPEAAPGQALSLVRITFEPGGYFASHGHPGTQIWYIDAGTLSTTIQEGTARLTRAPVGGTPTPAEHLAPGDAVTMLEGDALFFGPDLVHTVRNEGDETTVLLISAILAADQEPVIFHHEGTPVP